MEASRKQAEIEGVAGGSQQVLDAESDDEVTEIPEAHFRSKREAYASGGFVEAEAHGDLDSGHAPEKQLSPEVAAATAALPNSIGSGGVSVSFR